VHLHKSLGWSLRSNLASKFTLYLMLIHAKTHQSLGNSRNGLVDVAFLDHRFVPLVGVVILVIVNVNLLDYDRILLSLALRISLILDGRSFGSLPYPGRLFGSQVLVPGSCTFGYSGRTFVFSGRVFVFGVSRLNVLSVELNMCWNKAKSLDRPGSAGASDSRHQYIANHQSHVLQLMCRTFQMGVHPSQDEVGLLRDTVLCSSTT